MLAEYEQMSGFLLILDKKSTHYATFFSNCKERNVV